MADSTLHNRLSSAVGRKTYRSIATLTDTNAETVRRYLQGQAPSVEFLTSLSDGLGLNATWLLTGRGPMRAIEVKSHVLKEANAAELLSAMANTLSSLIERVDRLEVFVQSMETRLRVAATKTPSAQIETTGSAHEPGQHTDGDAKAKARRIGSALTQRPREDAD